MAEGDWRHQHLPLLRAAPINPKRTPGGFGGGSKPDDAAAHGRMLRDELDVATAAPAREPGFDPRRLLKLKVDGLQPSDLEAIPGLQVVSQEDKTIVVLFATEEGRAEFRKRVDLIARGEEPTRKAVFFAIKGVDEWRPEDRLGWALKREGLPAGAEFTLDVELWPLEQRGSHARDGMLDGFRNWCVEVGATELDRLDQESIVLVRLRLGHAVYTRLIQHRDVRTVDLPPTFKLTDAELIVDAGSLTGIPAPPPNAPVVAVLDSGIASNHPVLAPAVGDAQSFTSNFPAQDGNGHGTAVAGLALYGDVHACLTSGFVPRLRVLSGRVMDDAAQADTEFIENRITKAVDYFVQAYGCRVFNLSIGDSRKPYMGGHVRGLAVTLDTLARTRNVLFVVSAGNWPGDDAPDPNWLEEYPRYLLERETTRILDPAPALNVLTVGSLARFEQSRLAQRSNSDPGYRPIARKDQPSPFSCTGPGPNGAIKPEVVEHGGNVVFDARTGIRHKNNALLGVPAPNRDFGSTGRLFTESNGTSFAAPQVAHLAARLLGEYPNASANLLRALIVAHSSVPDATSALIKDPKDGRRLVGYGRPSVERCLYSSQFCVSLQAEDRIGENEHHFYEIPLPEDFLVAGRRARAVTVALAHMPFVRTTRVDYRGASMNFRVVQGPSLDAVTKVFIKTKKEDREPNIPEFKTATVTSRVRDRGTVQAGTYEVNQLGEKARSERLFVVVTRSVPKWAQGVVKVEPYAVVVVLEDRANQAVRYYQQIEIRVRERLRARV